MGVKQSKRSVDITETSTKGEIEGFGNEGKVEKIIDGVVEKVAANGHVEGDLQNGIEPHQNGVEPIQNGEAAAVATEEVAEKKDVDESPLEGVVNGQVENGEVNEDAEKTEEAKKAEEKKEKKKEKKDKVVKKKFSFRNFSFSKKDKSKPPKEEKLPGKVDETETEEALISSEKDVASSLEAHITETPKPEVSTKLEVDSSVSVVSNTLAEQVQVQEVDTPVPEKTAEISSKITAGPEDLPPPLPASPPPSEPIEVKLVSAMDKLDFSEPASENPSGEIDEIASSVSSVLTVKMETFSEAIKDAEQMAMETGQQIEDKATNLLKTVEERAEESMRTAGEFISQKTDEMQEMCQDELGVGVEKVEAKEDVVLDEAKKLDEGVPVEISSIGSLSLKKEEPTDKLEEGAGESLAEISKDLTDEVRGATIEVSNPDSLEIPAVPPPPSGVESVIGE